MPSETSNLDFFNDLSEHISIYLKLAHWSEHFADFMEHKVHSDYDIWFIQTGIIHITINNKTYIAKPGDIIFLTPNMPYIATSPDNYCRFLFAHFDFAVGGQKNILNDLNMAGIISSNFIKKEFDLYCKTFKKSTRLKTPGILLYQKACLTLVIAKIIECCSQNKYSDIFSSDNIHNAKKGLNELSPALHYINKNLQTAPKIKTLAELTGMSEKYFITFFKETLGVTPGQYIYQVKMNRAKDLLYEKIYTIQEISEFLGYADSFTFSKAFKKYYLISPSKFIESIG